MMETEKELNPLQDLETERKAKKKGKKEKPKKTVKQEILSWVWTLLAALAITIVFRSLVAEPIRVDGNSMKNTLLDGEVVLVSKLDYLFGDVQRGDVIICRYPGRTEGAIHLGAALSLQAHTLFVKRLVALPGDTLQITQGKLYVNDQLVEDPAFMGSVPMDFPRTRLRADEYFVIGDNRDNSRDSRSVEVGPIHRDAIMGKVKCVLLPFSGIRGIE